MLVGSAHAPPLEVAAMSASPGHATSPASRGPSSVTRDHAAPDGHALPPTRQTHSAYNLLKMTDTDWERNAFSIHDHMRSMATQARSTGARGAVRVYAIVQGARGDSRGMDYGTDAMADTHMPQCPRPLRRAGGALLLLPELA